MEEINASRPNIFGETINKKTVSKKTNHIKYEHGSLSREDRLFVDSAAKDAVANISTKLPIGYDATPIIKETIDFKHQYPQLSWRSPDLLYEKIMNDARNVIPRNRELKILVSDLYDRMIVVNLNNIYIYSPRFFTDNFIPKAGVNNAAFEAYQAYLYLLCFINYVDEHHNDPNVSNMDNINIIAEWVSVRRDPNIPFIIRGPSTNSDMSGTDFRAHYKSLISPSNNLSDILQYNQLSTLQTLGSDLFKLFAFMQNNPNVFIKTADEARKYNINIDSSNGVLVKIDSSNNLIFDCSYVNLGDTIERSGQLRYNDIETTSSDTETGSVINIRKLANLFHNYSRIRIVELIISPDTFISSLDSFRKVFVVFHGVNCSERNIYNNVSLTDLKFGGSFTRTNRGYEFKQDVDVVTYKSAIASVKNFEVYITSDPDGINKIIPNEYVIKLSKDDIYQHPLVSNAAVDTSRNTIRSFVPEFAVSHGAVLPSFDYKDGPRYNRENYVMQLKEILSVYSSTKNANVCFNQLNNVMKIVRKYEEDHVITIYSVVLEQIVKHIENLMQDFKNWHLAYNAYYTELTDDELEVFNIITKNNYDNLRFIFSPDTNAKSQSLNNIVNAYDYIGIRDILIRCIEYVEPDTSKITFVAQTSITNPMPLINLAAITDAAAQLYASSNIDEYVQRAKDFRNVVHQIIFANVDPSDSSFIKTMNEAMNIFSSIETFLAKWYSLVDDDYNIVREQLYRYKTLHIDTTKGTIDGKYFRIDQNGNVIFTDNLGVSFDSPDTRYVSYSINENDLCLCNLLKIIGGNIYNIHNGSFLYSERLNVIANLSTIVNSVTNSEYRYIFDNQYYVKYTLDNVQSNKIVVPSTYIETGLFKHWSSLVNYSTPIVFYKSIVRTYSRANDTMQFPLTPTSTTYKYIRIEDDTLITESTNNLSELGRSIDYELSGKDPLHEYTEYIDSNNKTITTEYRISKGCSDISMYYSYHDTKTQLIYNGSEWNIVIDIEGAYFNSSASNIYSNVVLNIDKYVNKNVEQTLYENCMIVLNGASIVNGICTIKIVNGNIYGTGYIYDLVLDDGNATNIRNVRMFVFTLIGLSTILSDAGSNRTSITINTLHLYPTVYTKIKSISICDTLNNKFIISNELEIDCSLFNKLEDIVYSVASQSTNDIYNNTIIMEYKYDAPNLILKHTIRDGTNGNSTYNILIIDLMNMTIYTEQYTSTNPAEVTRLGVLYNTSTIKPTYQTNALFNTNIFGMYVINNNMLVKCIQYKEECNYEQSNLYKAYSISGFDVKSQYWNKNMYISSLLFTLLPISTPLSDIDIFNCLLFNSTDENIYLFTRSGNKLTRIYGKYTILKSIILIESNNLLLNSGLDNIIVYNIGTVAKSVDINAVKYNADDNLLRQVRIEVDTDYVVVLSIQSMKIVEMQLYNKSNYKRYDNITLTYSDYIETVYIGSYSNIILSGYSTYIEDYEVVINYNIETTGLLIKSVSINHVHDDVFEYILIDHIIKRRRLYNIKFTNIPGKLPNITNDIFEMNIVSDATFKYFPCIKYIENIFVSPTYIDNRNRLATIARKKNQNIIMGPANIKSKYNTDTTMNASIAKQINPVSTYILESLDNQTLMIGDIPKSGLIDSLAINVNDIYIIPRSSKMNLTIEFS